MLRAEGYDVAGLDSDLYERCPFGNSMPNIPVRRKDIRDVQASDFREDGCSDSFGRLVQ